MRSWQFDRVENNVAVFIHPPRLRMSLTGQIEEYTETKLNLHDVKLRIRNLTKKAPWTDVSEEHAAIRALTGESCVTVITTPE